jgi:hypothetical protein
VFDQNLNDIHDIQLIIHLNKKNQLKIFERKDENLLADICSVNHIIDKNIRIGLSQFRNKEHGSELLDDDIRHACKRVVVGSVVKHSCIIGKHEKNSY